MILGKLWKVKMQTIKCLLISWHPYSRISTFVMPSLLPFLFRWMVRENKAIEGDRPSWFCRVSRIKPVCIWMANLGVLRPWGVPHAPLDANYGTEYILDDMLHTFSQV